MIIAALLLLSIVPHDLTHCQTVELSEVNHFYDLNGDKVFTQVIFWEWSRREARYQVVAWRLVKDKSQIPSQDFRDGGYVAVWWDGDVLRDVRAESMRETWLQYDPELLDREKHPKEWRRELSPVAGRKVCE